MALRERQHDDVRDPQPSPAGTATGQNPNSLRENAERLLAQGADAIERALSGSNSIVFLEAVRQEGGQ
jgi:hypothetical protein